MSNFSAISWLEQVTFQRDDDDLGQIILIPRLPVFALVPYRLSELNFFFILKVANI
jgi:hypothetical protein